MSFSEAEKTIVLDVYAKAVEVKLDEARLF